MAKKSWKPEVVSMVLFCIGQNVGLFWIKEATGQIRVLCVMENDLSIEFWLFFVCSYEEKTKKKMKSWQSKSCVVLLLLV